MTFAFKPDCVLRFVLGQKTQARRSNCYLSLPTLTTRPAWCFHQADVSRVRKPTWSIPRRTKMYCSELAWKIYKETFNIEIGKPERMGNFDLSNETVRKKARERYGDHIPEDEPVITPDAMFRAENLITITEH